MDSVPRDIGDQRKSHTEISSWADKVDKQGKVQSEGMPWEAERWMAV